MWIVGLGWTNQIESFTQPAYVHSDCVIGSPNSLSDERIKENVVALEPSTCLSFCNALSPSMYLRTDTDEIRSGLIAQSVKASLEQHSIPTNPIIGSEYASIDPGVSEPEELMALSYERRVPLLFGAVKELTKRVRQLEQQELESVVT